MADAVHIGELIDKISRGISDLIVYAEYNDEKNFERALNSLKICNQEIYNAGIF